ncbi:MAG: VIT1/CCC1 transporter family protein [Planctomycetota bacterium]
MARESASPHANEPRRKRHSYLSDFIYGGIDGSVTTFAIVSGVAGAGLEPAIIVVLGCANLLGDGFSMAAANLLGVRADWQHMRRIRERELAAIKDRPDEKRGDVERILAAKGLQGGVLDGAADAITADRDRWADCIVREGHGLALEPRSPWRAAAMTFVSFFVIGAVPLVPFGAELAGVAMGSAYSLSTALVAVAMFTVGTLKCLFVSQRWWLGGLETLAVGGLAAGLAFLVGWLLRGLV